MHKALNIQTFAAEEGEIVTQMHKFTWPCHWLTFSASFGSFLCFLSLSLSLSLALSPRGPIQY